MTHECAKSVIRRNGGEDWAYQNRAIETAAVIQVCLICAKPAYFIGQGRWGMRRLVGGTE